MPAVAKFVLLPLRPDTKREFLELLEANRQHTKQEPGTQLWTLHSVRDQPDSVAMYEVYDDEDASKAHDTGNPALAVILDRLPEFLSGEPTILTLDITATRQDP
jgi:quinol monooxygenase YgiN